MILVALTRAHSDDHAVLTSCHNAFEDQAAVAHDARNSVAALQLLVEAVRDGVLEVTPESGVIDGMLVHVRLLSELLGLHDGWAAAPAGAPIVRAVHLGALLEQWSQAMLPKAEARQVDLRIAIAPDLPEVECRADQVSRVLLNLIDNAIRHTPAGGTVLVRCFARSGGVQVHVDDAGPGLPQAVRTGVLGPSGSGHVAGRPGRMGLMIARAIVEAHGGALWAASPPRGASVRFYLPATAIAAG